MSTITTDIERRTVESAPTKLFIGGEWVDGEAGTLPV
jgi:hypothetical protein